MNTKHEFDAYAKNYRENLNKALSLSGETSDFFAQYKAQKLHEWFAHKLPPTPSILDFGCGDGTMTNYVQELFTEANILGIDPSKDSISIAQKMFSRPSFEYCHEENFPNKSFDLIYAAGVFHHIPFEKHQSKIAELIKRLNPNGFFVLFELNPYNPLTRRTFNNCPIDKNATMLTPAYAKKLLKPLGNVSLKYYCFFPAQLKKLRPTEKYLEHFFLGALYACIVQKKGCRS